VDGRGSPGIQARIVSLRDDILAQARARSKLSYSMDPLPDGITTTDCSLLVRDAVRAAGAGELPRTAEQQRQATIPISWDEVLPGDLLFFENTYDANEAPGPDGSLATHVGISLGKGSHTMIDAHERAGPDVGETNIGTPYWQDRAIEARRLPALVGKDDGLTSVPDHQFTFEQLWPTIKAAGDEFGFSPEVLAGIVAQESSFKNYRVHFDGTGHGLLGLDDGGMLPGFEQWSGLNIGRGSEAASIPIVPQIRYAAKVLAQYARQYGDPWAAARAWHRGTGALNDARGLRYEQLIRGHIDDLFADGEPDSGSTSDPGYETKVRYLTDPNGPVIAALRTRVEHLRTEAQEIDNVINEILRNKPGD
jgi:hypothetical protein